MKKETTRAVNLNARDYLLAAKRLYSSSKRKQVIQFNFKKSPVDVEVLFGTGLQNAVATQAAALFMQGHEIFPAAAKQLRFAASSEFEAIDRKAKLRDQSAKVQLRKLQAQYSSAELEASTAKNAVAEAEKSMPTWPGGGGGSGVSAYGAIGCAPGDEKCRQQLEKYQAAWAKLNDAGRLYSQKMNAVTDIRKQLDAETVTISRLSDQMRQVRELQNIAQEFDREEASREEFRNQIVRSAQERWTKNLVIDNRGINLHYSGGSVLAQADVKQLVEFFRQHAQPVGRLQLEIEVPELQKSPNRVIEKPDEIDVAKKIERQLRDEGLLYAPIAMRTFLSSRDDENIRIIISPVAF
jgi:hypothetical protein